MGDNKQNAGSELSGVLKKGKKETELAALQQDEESSAATVEYRQPLLNVVDAPMALAGQPLVNYDDAYFNARRAREAVQAQQTLNQIAAERTIRDQFMPGFRQSPQYDTMVPFYHAASGTMRLREGLKSPKFLSDPLVQHSIGAFENATAKIQQLKVDMTAKQRIRIDRRLRSISFYRKGKKESEAKSPSVAQVNKVLYLAFEMNASRRRAQLGAQMRRARAERHSLVQKKRTLALPDGSVINYNKRAAKKEYADAVRKQAKQEASANIQVANASATERNKATRAAVKANRPKSRAAAGQEVRPRREEILE